MILSFLFYAFLVYLLYKLVFDFFLPLYRTTRRIKKSFREMNERMQQGPGSFRQQTPPQQKPVSQNKPGDYIDFEEVKE